MVLTLAAMNFFMSNSLSRVIPKNLIVSEPFTTSFPTLISGKYYFFRPDLDPNVINSVFCIVHFEVVLVHLITNMFDV